MKKKMKLGPIQKAWVESLLAHPERQMVYQLGKRKPKNVRNYTACCLGEGLCVLARINKKRLPFDEKGILKDTVGDISNMNVLQNSFDKLGLRNNVGSLKESFKGFNSLGEFNDNGFNWVEIANYIKENPENIFIKSV